MTEIFMLNMFLILPVLRGADSPTDANIQFVLIGSKYKGVKITHIATSLINTLNVLHSTAVSEKYSK